MLAPRSNDCEMRKYTKHPWCALLAVAAICGGCASEPAAPDADQLRLNALLDEVSAQYAEEGARRCLPTSAYGSVAIVDEHRLIFRSRRDKAWLNELRHACLGLRRGDTLMFDLHGSSVCEMDTIAEIDRFLVWTRTGPTCTLGRFMPIPPGYAETIADLM